MSEGHSAAAEDLENTSEGVMVKSHLNREDEHREGCLEDGEIYSDESTPTIEIVNEDMERQDVMSTYKANNPLYAPGGEPKVHIKLLVSNAAAGSIIGKGGSTIGDFQQKSGARIQLSRNGDFFPGTPERVLLVAGRMKTALTALTLILAKLVKEGVAPLDPRTADDDTASLDDPILQLKLIVPNTLCGIIIGKQGSTIRGFIEESGCNIKVSSQDYGSAGSMFSRIVSITGRTRLALRGIQLVVGKMAEDTKFQVFARMPFSLPTGLGAAPQFMPGHPGPLYKDPNNVAPFMAPPMQMPYGPPMPMQAPIPYGMIPYAEQFSSIVVGVPDEQVGIILGKGGKNISELQQVTSVRIKISDREDFVPRSRHRKLTLSGNPDAVRVAHWLITQKLNQVLSSPRPPPPKYMAKPRVMVQPVPPPPAALARAPYTVPRTKMERVPSQHRITDTPQVVEIRVDTTTEAIA